MRQMDGEDVRLSVTTPDLGRCRLTDHETDGKFGYPVEVLLWAPNGMSFWANKRDLALLLFAEVT